MQPRKRIYAAVPSIAAGNLSSSYRSEKTAAQVNASPTRPVSSSSSRISSQTRTSSQSKLHFNPQAWDVKRIANQPEDDDDIHNPDTKIRLSRGNTFNFRGLVNLGCLIILLICILGLFVGYPVASWLTETPIQTFGVNKTGQVPQMVGNWGLVDSETPEDARNFASYNDGSEWELVFSDEFNTDGRSFYPGDDPYWEAVNLNYWQTGDLNWYDPSAITTKDGALEITFSQQPSHGFEYMGGMLSTWNKFCFTGGLIQASVSLPGANDVSGFWPAIWTLGNLGRVGYGATVEGMWPYSYDSCDVGTVANQSVNGLPPAASEQGPFKNATISQLPGQRLSRCTCPGEDHPGPKHSDGTFVGRSAPEIDMFEAQIDGTTGAVSQSAQWAPFNNAYEFLNSSSGYSVNNWNVTIENPYQGGLLQQATSYVSDTNPECYEKDGGCFSTYAVEYQPGYEADNAYITWVANGKQTWTLNAAGMGADPVTNISARPISQEPMYLIANLGMASSFAFLDFANLTFPAVMRIDWIRVYQPSGSGPQDISCDPDAHPTADYINANLPAYSNPNFTGWQTSISGYNKTFPKNSLVDGC